PVRIEAGRSRANELAACRAVHASVNVSAPDRRRLTEAGVPESKTHVILPGVDPPSMEPSGPLPPGTDVVFVGSMSYVPNVDAVTFFARDVLPLVTAAVPGATAAGRCSWARVAASFEQVYASVVTTGTA